MYTDFVKPTMYISVPTLTLMGFVNSHRRCKKDPFGLYIIEIWLSVLCGATIGGLAGVCWPIFWSTPILWFIKKLDI